MTHTDVINSLWEVLNKSLLIYLERESTESTEWSYSTFSTCLPISTTHSSYRSQNQQHIKATWGEMVSHLWNRLKDLNCEEETKRICHHYQNMSSPTAWNSFCYYQTRIIYTCNLWANPRYFSGWVQLLCCMKHILRESETTSPATQMQL